MEQIVKIFVHQSYYIENDLVVDYNVVPGAHVNVSPKDWIALIPKGWSGVDKQVVFKTVNTDNDIANLAIKSVIMEKKCFQNVVKCEKLYQLMYIGQYLEILGRSDYFTFLHQSSTCNCLSSLTNTDNTKQFKSSVFSRKPPRRQSPTPHQFYKNQFQLKNNEEKGEKLKSKQFSSNLCIKCNAPSNFTVLENAYLSKIQELTINTEIMEQRLLQVDKDLVHTLDIINKQFKIIQVISQQRDNIQQFVDNIIHGLLNDGKTTFWAHSQEISVVRNYPNKNQTSFPSDDCPIVATNTPINLSKEAHLKAIIGQQEQTIQLLVNKIRDYLDIFFKANIQCEQNCSILTSPKNEISIVSYLDNSGSTYFFSLPYISDTLDDIDFCLSNSIKNNKIEKKKDNLNFGKLANNITSKFKVTTTSNKEVKDEILTLEEWKKYKNPIHPLHLQLSKYTQNYTNELFINDEVEKNNDLEGN